MTEQSPKTLTKQELRKAQQRIFFLPTERFAKKLGKHISLARRKRCLTQKMLAERALISLATLQRLEKGDSSVSMAAVMRVLFILDASKVLMTSWHPPGTNSAAKRLKRGCRSACGRRRDIGRRKQLLTKVRSFIVTVLSRRLNIRLVLLQPLRHQPISQTEQVPTCI